MTGASVEKQWQERFMDRRTCEIRASVYASARQSAIIEWWPFQTQQADMSQEGDPWQERRGGTT